ncbi:MAG: AsmA family protein [Bacteroidetes bacterium]|nr:AsmA family protein [Bacteroidota bacterium]
MLKKILKISGISVLVLLIALITAPFLFKGKIVKAIKKAANTQLNGTLDFDNDISLSLLRSFPKLSVGINKLSILGKDSFAGDTLVYFPELRLSMDLMSAIKGEEIKIRTIKLSRPRINIETLPSGRANWDILKPDTSKAPATDTTGGAFKMALNSLVIENGHITYNDRSLGFTTELKDVNHESSGDFTQDNFTLKTHTETPSLTLGYGGIDWLYQIKTNVDADLGMDMKAMKFSFREAKAKLNELNIQSDGYVDLNDEDMDMDISFKALQNSFRNFLSLVPGMYSSNFKDVKTEGTMAFQGSLKGKMTDTRMPATAIALQIANASFRYPGLQYPADNIHIDLKFNNPDGEPDHSVVDINKFNLRLAGEPFSLKMLLKTPVSDPYINANVLGKLDLGKIQSLIPLEKGTQLAGLVDADLSAVGNYSAATSKNFSRLDAKGKLHILNLLWKLPTDKDATEIRELKLDFTPQQVNMPVCKGHIGKNDFDASGSLSNMLGYMFAGEKLTGTVKLKSQYMNINSLMADAPAEEPKATDTGQLTMVELPANLDLSLDADIKKLIYDNYILTDLGGHMHLENGELNMEGIKASLLGGTLGLNGKYDSKNIKNPFTAMDLTISRLNLAENLSYFPMLKKFAPMAAHVKGLVNAKIEMNSILDQHMQPNYESMNVNALFSFTDNAVEGLDALKEIGRQLNVGWIEKIKLTNQTVKFRIQEGMLKLMDSLALPVGNGAVMKLGGYSKLDQTLHYGGWIKIPRKAMGTANNVLDGWVKQASSKGINLSVAETIPVDLGIGGTFLKPKIDVSLKGFQKALADDLKDQGKKIVTDEANKKLKEALAEARKRADQVKAEAKKRADQIRAEGRQAGDKIRAEGKTRADQIRNEGSKAAQTITDQANAQAANLEAQAKDPISKAAAKKGADKIRQEGQKKADATKGEFNLRAKQVEDEANKRAGQVEDEANKRADKIEQEASDKADQIMKEAEAKGKL